MTPYTISLSITDNARAALLDLRQLIITLAARPTHVSEILPTPVPEYIGYCDARAFDAGGVWLSGQCPLPETAWQLQWPADFSVAVISEATQRGR